MRRDLLGVCAVLLLTGCARSVDVTAGPAATSAGCAAVAASWPAQVGDATLIETRPEDPSTAAWAAGDDPAIIARCGVPLPGPTTAECIAVDDVDWIAEQLDDGMRLTTYGRDPAVEVLVPDHYAPEPLVLSSFGDPARAGEPTGHHCS